MYRNLVILIWLCQLLPAGRGFAQQVEQMLRAKPVVLSGNFSATSIFYSASGIPNRYPSFNYVITGSPVLSVYGWQIPVSFVIGKQQNSFTQPFNQFGMSPSYKWITLHAGYRSIQFSPNTLAGHTFLGGGIELNPGKFRFAAIYGQFNKATAFDTANNLFFSNFSYKRMGMSVRIGYGTENNFFDLIALKAKDDAGNIGKFKSLADSAGIAPAENTIGGYNMQISFFRSRISFESNGALSLYTSDLHAPPLTDSSIDKVARPVNNLLTIRTSSELYSAIEAAVRYKARDFSLRIQYRRIDPGFQSMGAYFLNNDLENYTLAPAFSAWKRRIRFSGSLGFQRDDLARTKRARAEKIIGSANLSADLSERLGIDLNYSNYSVSQNVKTIRFADSLKVVQSSAQFACTPRYTITGTTLSHTILFSANLSNARELNPARADSTNGDIDTYNYLLNYQLNFIQALASVYLSLNHTEMKSQLLKDGNDGITLGSSKTLFRNRLNLALSGSYLLSKRNGDRGTILTGSFQSRYNFYGRHQLRLTAYYTGNTPDKATAEYPRFTESRAELGYGFSF